MRHNYIYLTLSILAILLLAACQSAPPAPPTPAAVPKRVILEKLPPQGYAKRGIDYLAKGDTENARLYLTEAVALDPANKKARMLLEHLDADPEQVLGRESQPYAVRRGQTLTDIARKYLGDSLKFHILARYNGISDPRRLQAGQMIRLPSKARLEPAATAQTKPPVNKPAKPGEETAPAAIPLSEQPAAPAVGQVPAPAEPAAPAAAPAGPVEVASKPPPAERPQPTAADAKPKAALSDYDKARQFYQDGNYRGAIAVLESSAADERSRDLLASSYTAMAEGWQNSGDLAKARAGFQQALRLQPANAAIKQRLDSINSELGRRDNEQVVKQGIAERQEGRLESAYSTLGKVPAEDPNYAQAQQQRADIRSTLVDDYHRRALVAYKQQDLCKAIGLWDQALALNPAHAPASSNRERARAVAQKLGQSCR